MTEAIPFRAAAAAALLLAGLGLAAAHSNPDPFADFDGIWSGAGTLSLADGTKERVRCRNQYLVTRDGSNLQQALRCSSDRYEFHVNTYVDADETGVLSGSWTEMTRNITGRINGRVDGNRVTVTVGAGGAFSATMTIVTTGNRQSVRIEPTGMDVTLVSVQLRKSK
jgi:hypothetical protein